MRKTESPIAGVSRSQGTAQPGNLIAVLGRARLRLASAKRSYPEDRILFVLAAAASSAAFAVAFPATAFATAV